MIRSLRPSPYTSAVSKNVTPDSTAARRTLSASSSVTLPQSAPSCQVPRPMTDTWVWPSARCSMTRDPTQCAARVDAMDLDPDALLNGRVGRLMLAELAEALVPGAGIAEVMQRAGQDPGPWFTDPAALLRLVAAAAEGWGFDSQGQETDRQLRAEAESLRPLAE